eukprot:COSAG02_NODE_5900_length_3950_cov_51.280966_1_plen_193_part_00
MISSQSIRTTENPGSIAPKPTRQLELCKRHARSLPVGSHHKLYAKSEAILQSAFICPLPDRPTRPRVAHGASGLSIVTENRLHSHFPAPAQNPNKSLHSLSASDPSTAVVEQQRYQVQSTARLLRRLEVRSGSLTFLCEFAVPPNALWKVCVREKIVSSVGGWSDGTSEQPANSPSRTRVSIPNFVITTVRF